MGISAMPEKRLRNSAAAAGIPHALMFNASVQGQLALLVRLQWIAGQRAAEVVSNAPYAAVVVQKQRILWFDRGEDTKAAQHHQDWVVFDHAHPSGQPPATLYG